MPPPPPPITAPIKLLPIVEAPLPYQWKFNVEYDPKSGIDRSKLILGVYNATAAQSPQSVGWLLSKHEVIGEQTGFSELLLAILNYAKSLNLWGQKLQLYANYGQASNNVLSSTQSAPVALELPAGPLYGMNPDRTLFLSTLPNPPLPPSQGTRVFFNGVPNTPGSPLVGAYGWFAGADNRLTGVGDLCGHSRISFWISLFGLAIKSTKGIDTGDALAVALGAYMTPMALGPGPKPTVAQIMAHFAIRPKGLARTIFWNADRFFFCRPDSGAACFEEFGPSGYKKLTVAQWAAGQSPSAAWNVRQVPPVVPAKYGKASVV